MCCVEVDHGADFMMNIYLKLQLNLAMVPSKPTIIASSKVRDTY